jgi:hypothetical protein
MFNKILCNTHNEIVDIKKKEQLTVRDYVHNIEQLLNNRSFLKLAQFRELILQNKHIPPQYIGTPCDIETYIDNHLAIEEFFQMLVKTIDQNINQIILSDISYYEGNLKISIVLLLFSHTQ